MAVLGPDSDAAAANLPGERLLEHFHRWNFALAHFRVFNPERKNQFARVEMMFEGLDPCITDDAGLYELLSKEQPMHPGDRRHREPLLDHRGLVYLHHGSPYRIVYSNLSPREPAGFALADPPDPALVAAVDKPVLPEHFLGCIPHPVPYIINPRTGQKIYPPGLPPIVVDSAGPNESWLYWFGGRWRVMNFRASCALGLDRATTLSSYLPVTAVDVSWAARSDLTPEYAAAAQARILFPGEIAPRSCRDSVLLMIWPWRRRRRRHPHRQSHTIRPAPMERRGSKPSAWAQASTKPAKRW